MISETALQKVESLANEVATREGVKIYDVEFAGGAQGRTLRVFIEKDGGVSIEDCANVSRGLNELLDETDPIPGGNYSLEVSSPGLERPLKKTWHYEASLGKKVALKLNKALENFGVTNPQLKTAKNITEKLLGIENDQIKLQVGDEEAQIPMTAVEKAKLVFEFNEGKQEKKGHPKKGAHKK